MPSLTSGCLDQFSTLLAARQIPSEIIVKSLVMTIGAHWQARLSQQSTTAETSKPTKKIDTEAVSLEFLLGMATVLLELATHEVSQGLTDDALEAIDADISSALSGSAVLDDDDDDYDLSNPEARLRRASGEDRSMASSVAEPSSSARSGSLSNSPRYLAQNISAVLRRLLPSLRIFSKWIKSNLEYLIRTAVAPATPTLGTQLARFWAAYCRFLNCVQAAFPISRLPSLDEPLEEDVDMRGFTPLKRGIMEPVGRSDAEDRELGDEPNDVHPNEEQLMRIADLSVDGKLLAQAEVSVRFRDRGRLY
jgi:hypothetical protein